MATSSDWPASCEDLYSGSFENDGCHPLQYDIFTLIALLLQGVLEVFWFFNVLYYLNFTFIFSVFQKCAYS